MDVKDVEKDDCKTLADFLHALRQMSGNGTAFGAMIAFVDGVRWLQDLAIRMAEVYSEEMDDAKQKDKAKGEGFTVKSYNPGASE